MANGLYGKVTPNANEVTKLTDAATPNGKIRAVVIGACNRTGNAARISIAYSTAAVVGDVQNVDWKAVNRPLEANAEYERTHQLLHAGEHVYVKSDIAGINFDVRGYEGNA